MQDWITHGMASTEPHQNSAHNHYQNMYDEMIAQYWLDRWVKTWLQLWFLPMYVLGSISDGSMSNLCQANPRQNTYVKPSNIKLPPTM